ncbi:MAG: TIGR02147 family protein [Pseudobdellovibrionaceae bacterium]
MISVFDFTDYREFLLAKRKEGSHLRGFQTKMANAAGCQRAYLSQVMHGHVQLTPDHGIGLAELFELNEDEREYLLNLINLERARTKLLKDWFIKRLKAQQQARQNLAKRLQANEEIQSHHEIEYYSKWYFSAIHILVGIPQFSSPKEIAIRLGLSVETVNATLTSLGKMGLVEQNGKRWDRSKQILHVAQSKPMNVINHLNWRHKAIGDIQHEPEHSLHYTAIHSLSVKDMEVLRTIFVEAIAKSRAVVGPSKDEELICLTCDLFAVRHF